MAEGVFGKIIRTIRFPQARLRDESKGSSPYRLLSKRCLWDDGVVLRLALS